MGLHRILRGLLATKRWRGPSSATVRRLDLSNGEWWDLETRPTMREFQEMQEAAKGAETGDETASYRILAKLSRGWSFDGPLTSETILDRNIDDLIKAMEVFTAEVVPFLEQVPGRLTQRSYSTPSVGEKSQPDTS